MSRRLLGNHWKTIIASLLGGAVLTMAMWWGPLWAQDRQATLFFSPPVFAQVDDTVRVGFVNTGRSPVRVTIFLLDAEDSSLIHQSETFFKAPDGGAFTDITASLGLGIIAAVRVEGRSRVRLSLQVIDADGQTQIFTDGFESGNTSR